MKKNLLPKLVLPILVASSTIIGANQTKVSAAPIKDAEVTLTQPMKMKYLVLLKIIMPKT